jgi:hypothetical protein
MPAIERSAVAGAICLFSAFTLAGSSSPGASVTDGPDTSHQEQRALLRMARDSLVVGHYRFSVQEVRRLAFDIPSDDPRAELLRSAGTPKEKQTDVAATVVSTPAGPDAERRYIAYWLGYRIIGDDVQGLSPVQWDSIFQVVGRRGIVRFTSRGQPRGVEVASDAVRPVAQALANTLSGLAMELPLDSVVAGGRWGGNVAVNVDAPDGSRLIVPVQVRYRLREFQEGPDGLVARIEFDGEPVPASDDAPKATGQYYGESYFSVTAGRYNRIMALANLEVEWHDPSGLPPGRWTVRWRGDVVRR